MGAGSPPISHDFFSVYLPREREELLLVCVAFCCVHEASITIRKSSLCGMADISDSCLHSHVQKQSWGERFPAVPWDVPGYGTLKPQAWVLKLGNTWLRYDGSRAGGRQGGSPASLNLVSLSSIQCGMSHSFG